MKEYKDMNIFDMASLLLEMVHDEDLNIGLKFNDRPFNFYKVEVNDGAIYLHTCHDGIELKDKDVKPSN